MANQKNHDDEKSYLLLVGLIFTVGLVCVDVFYSDWRLLFSGWVAVGGVVAVISHIGAVLGWYVSLSKLDDPNFDGARKMLLGFLILALAIVGGTRAASNEFKSVLDDAKQESTR